MKKQYALLKPNIFGYKSIKYTHPPLGALAEFLCDVGQSSTGAEIKESLVLGTGYGGNISYCHKDSKNYFSILAEIEDPEPEIIIKSEEFMKILSQWDEVRKSAPPYIILTQEGTSLKLEGSDHVPEHLLDERIKKFITEMDNSQYALKK